MVLHLRMLLIGSLLWNSLASGQISSSTDNSGGNTTSPTSQSTLNPQTPSINALPTAQSEYVPSTSDTQAPARNGTKPAINSSAVLTASPFISYTTLYPVSGDLATTQAPKLTAALTSSFTSSAGPSPLTGNSTSGVTSSSDSHQPTSSPTINLTPTTAIDNTSRGIDCTGLRFGNESYKTNKANFSLDNYPKDLNISAVQCSRNVTISGSNFIVDLEPCEEIQIYCNFTQCEQQPGPINLTQPPTQEMFHLKVMATNTSLTFDWVNTNNTPCRVDTSVHCSNGTHEKSGGTTLSELTPYTNYTCRANLIYEGTVIKTENRTIQTKPGVPGIIKNLACIGGSEMVTFTWDKPEKKQGPIDGYQVTFKEENGKKKDKNPELPIDITTTNSSFSKGGLGNYTEYTLIVSAYNKDEDKALKGKKDSKSCRTNTAKPEKVEEVKSHVGPNNVITIKCNDPQKKNGPDGKFILEYDNIRLNKTKCDFRLENLNYLTTYKFKIFYNNTEFTGEAITEVASTKYNDKALIGFLVFLIILTSLALMLVLFKIYKLQKRGSSHCEQNYPLFPTDDETLIRVIEPIPVEHLLETYKRKNADEGRLFLDEFQSIPRVFTKYTIKEARKSCNQPKNRYVDILPYDDNRVILSEIHGDNGSDYINASYINGFKEPKKYIAAQGPKDETMNDFWRMIWEQKSSIIVMVTRCEEGNRNKCAQYWPSLDEDTETFGDIIVKITDENIFPDYITRKLHVVHKREKSEREVTHIQFTVWPDHGVPDEPNLLLKLRRRVNALSNFFSGPIIVHCSAGVGRTGTYISIDAMLERLEAEGSVNVYDFVVQLRRQRCLMVQVESQYIFIHKSLVEYNQFGETEINIPEVAMALKNLNHRDSMSEPSQMDCEFQRLPTYRNWRPQTAGNHHDNKEKNRNPSIVPYEYNRVIIKLEEEQSQESVEDSDMSSDEESDCDESTKYINASYITGYWGTRELIATQGPLKNTISDFWQMVFQRKVRVIVALSAPSEENKVAACAPYWEEKKQTYDDLVIELTEEKKCGSYTERSFELRHSKRKEVRKLCQYQYGQWESIIPGETKDLLEMIRKIRNKVPTRRAEEQSKHDKSVPVLVHCSDGSQQTGTFCGLWNLLESTNVEGVIDVFQTIKNLRKQRPGMVCSFEHYQFLYNIIASTVPAQNGQVKKARQQEDKVEIQKELQKNVPESKESEAAPEDQSKSSEDEATANGPSAAPFTEVSLRIDE
ncbi:receptor-type tyrosine-protein phosphatase C isoform X2 [Bombina bombina]|uniref:receptor-type tyrosine-protein phosphatase C isoform X2 n=1 Tax=Bombina bombina TaxID=8345 RepID=UPI00235B225D|nr:receptor-type tyrosine-protein phosphatase C isoform X2 [Bombina bombina]